VNGAAAIALVGAAVGAVLTFSLTQTILGFVGGVEGERPHGLSGSS
jgi:hypothetical protein